MLVLEIWQTQGFENEKWCFLGPTRVLIQERETTSEGVRMKGVVWITEGTSLVRCAVQHLRSLTESEKRLRSIADTESISFQDLVKRLPHTTFLISRHRQMLLMMLGKTKSQVGTHEAHDIQAVAVLSGRINMMQHHVLGPDLMPPSRSMRTDDENVSTRTRNDTCFCSTSFGE